MAKKKAAEDNINRDTSIGENIEISGAGIVTEEGITDTLRQNYMPYAMSVIVSRALPEIDGFKPAHRKLLYTMYTMGLLNDTRTKSANVVGQTMKLNPHGDAAIYETMVRMTRANESLLHPYVDSKGNFGKCYSRDMAYAASRYTEVKLADICSELFSDIAKDTVDFADNYDNRMKEPTLLPARFPTILVNSTLGIAVGMASSICSFNLREICDASIGLIKDPEFDLLGSIKGPDFPGGGIYLYDERELNDALESGRGSLRIRSKYRYDKKNNCIEVYEIPYTTTVEEIMDKMSELIKLNKLRELSDMRDETDKSGLKLTFDLKRGVDPDKLMMKLFRFTKLEDSFSCNFNILINGYPVVLGVRKIILEWLKFRRLCVERRTAYDLSIKRTRLHLLEGLAKILLDIDKAIRIVRETREERDVVPNLMIGFGIDEVQAEYVAEIKLRHLNREYILKRTSEIEGLISETRELEDVVKNSKKIDAIIITELKNIREKYGFERRTEVLRETAAVYEPEEEKQEDYAVTLFFTAEGYFKKILPQSLRMYDQQKLKDGDRMLEMIESTNNTELLFFTNKQQVYKCRAYDFRETKASAIGEYVAAALGMEEGETAIYMVATQDYKGTMLFAFENGKVAQVELSKYETKQNRKKLINAYSASSPIVAAVHLREADEIALFSSSDRLITVSSGLIPIKQSRDTQGVSVMTLKKKATLVRACLAKDVELSDRHRYRIRKFPVIGAQLRSEDVAEQTELD